MRKIFTPMLMLTLLVLLSFSFFLFMHLGRNETANSSSSNNIQVNPVDANLTDGDDEEHQRQEYMSKLEYPLDCSQLPFQVGNCLNLKNPYNRDKLTLLFHSMVVMNSKFISSKLPKVPFPVISFGLPFSSLIIETYDVPMKNSTVSFTSMSDPSLQDNEFNFLNEAIVFSGSGRLFFIPFTFSTAAKVSFWSKVCIPTKNNVINIYNTRLRFKYFHVLLTNIAFEWQLGVLLKTPLACFINFFVEVFRLICNLILFLWLIPAAFGINFFIYLQGRALFSSEDATGIPDCPAFKN